MEQARASSEKPNLDVLSKAIFALLTLAVLWVASGTDASLFWARLPVFSFICLLLCGGFVCANPSLRKSLRRPSAQNFKHAYPLALIALVPACALAILLSKTDPSLYTHSGALPEIFRGFPIWTLLPVGIAAYFIEYFMRAYLSPQWGPHNVVLLEAIVCGIAFQHLAAFLVIYIAGQASHYSMKKWGISTTALMRSLWILMLIISLRIAHT